MSRKVARLVVTQAPGRKLQTGVNTSTSNDKHPVMKKPEPRSLISLVMAICLMLAVVFPAHAQIPTPSPNTAGVEVVEKDGTFSWSEKRFLLRMLDTWGPKPEKIIIEEAPGHMGEGIRGWVQDYRPEVIHLTPLRRADLNETTPADEGPYQMGRGEVYPNGLVTPQTFILAHEIGHVIAPDLGRFENRPALAMKGFREVVDQTYEIEAEVVGMVLMKIAFDLSPEQMGIPKYIEYDSVRDKKTTRLVRTYCRIIEQKWRMRRVDCSK